MSFTYATQDSWIRLVGDGVVSMVDRADCVQRMLADNSLPVPSHVLIDVCTVVNSPTVDDIPMIRLMIRLLQSKFLGKVAILNTVVGHTFLSHAIAIEVWDNCRAFHSAKEARDWFGE